jgi:hypothetical protein
MAVSGQRHAPGRAKPLGKGPPVASVQEAGWAPEPLVDTEAKRQISYHCRESNRLRPVVQSVARHYTDWATRLLLLSWKLISVQITIINLFIFFPKDFRHFQAAGGGGSDNFGDFICTSHNTAMQIWVFVNIKFI